MMASGSEPVIVNELGEFLMFDVCGEVEPLKGPVVWTASTTKFLLHEFGKRKNNSYRTMKMLHTLLADLLNKEFNLKLTPDQVANKLKSLERAYKKHVDNDSKTGRGAKFLEFEEELTNLFGKKKNVHPEILLSEESEFIATPSAANSSEVDDPGIEVAEENIVIEYVPAPSCQAVPKEPTTPRVQKKKRNRKMLADVLEVIRGDKNEFYKVYLNNQQKAMKLVEERNNLLKQLVRGVTPIDNSSESDNDSGLKASHL